MMVNARRSVIGTVLVAGALLALAAFAGADGPGCGSGKAPYGARCGFKVPITCQQSSDGLFAPECGRLRGKCQYASTVCGGQCRRGVAGGMSQCGACPRGAATCERASDCACRVPASPCAEFRGASPCLGSDSLCARDRQPSVGCTECAKAAQSVRLLRDGSVGLKVAVRPGAKACLALVLYGKDGVPVAHPDVLSVGIEGANGAIPVALEPLRQAWHGSFDLPVGGEYTVVVHARMLGGAMETAVFPLAMSDATRARSENQDKADNTK
jgi:hypothetical protein